MSAALTALLLSSGGAALLGSFLSLDEAVRVVLADPRMKGLLPPSFQPSQPMGPLSRAARWLVGW